MIPRTTREVEVPAVETPVDKVMGRVTLIVHPPHDLNDILQLQNWMQDSAHSDLVGISAWGTALKVELDIKQPIPLFSMLKDLPFISELTREPFAAGRPAAGASQRFGLTLQPTP